MKWITIQMPRSAWDIMLETLELDSQSSAFDKKLRERIRAALRAVQILPSGDRFDQ